MEDFIVGLMFFLLISYPVILGIVVFCFIALYTLNKKGE